jgi:predicted enzyme related to lactoylglutathione lyase
MPLNLIEGQYAPGDPITADLATDDPSAALAFYGPLFGWDFEDVDEHLRAVKGRRMAAGVGMMEALDLPGSRWFVCFAAPDLDELAERAASSASGRMHLPGLGKATVLEDPTGAKSVLWQPDRLEPGALGATHGGLVWVELVTNDPEAAAAFYAPLFDATPIHVGEQGGAAAPASAIDLERQELEVPRRFAGIVSSSGTARVSSGPRWRPYFQVDDLRSFIEAAMESGGKLIEERPSGSGRAMAILHDPQGAEFGVVEGHRPNHGQD